MDPYHLTFIDSLLAALIFPFDSELIFYALAAFGTYNTEQALFAATFAFTIGMAINYGIGRIIRLLQLRYSKRDEKNYWQRAAHIFNHYGVVALLFCWAPGGNILGILAGFLHTRWYLYYPILLLGLIWHYQWWVGRL